MKKSATTASFAEKVFSVVRKIPRGSTMTYIQVAKAAGNVQAARAVGSILHTNYNPQIPCHRVVRSDGMLGGYNRGLKNKKIRLMSEAPFRDIFEASSFTKKLYYGIIKGRE